MGHFPETIDNEPPGDSSGRRTALSLTRVSPVRPAHPGRPKNDRDGQVSWLAGQRRSRTPAKRYFAGNPFGRLLRTRGSQWHLADGSPLTVAGAAGDWDPVPFSCPSPGNLSQCGRLGRCRPRVNGASKPRLCSVQSAAMRTAATAQAHDRHASTGCARLRGAGGPGDDDAPQNSIPTCAFTPPRNGCFTCVISVTRSAMSISGCGALRPVTTTCFVGSRSASPASTSPSGR